jgi:adenylate cyclase
LTGGDAHLGDFVIESPLTVAEMFRATARMCLGGSGWQSDMDEASAMCREHVPLGQAVLFFWRYGYGVSAGAIRADAAALRETAEVLELATQTGDNLSLESGRFLHGYVLVKHGGPDRDRGLDLLAAAREAAIQGRCPAVIAPLADIEFAKETARSGDLDEAIQRLGTVIEHATAGGGMGLHGAAVEALVELLLQRGTREDVHAAQGAIERLAAEPTEAGFVVYDLALLRLRALLAQAQGDESAYRDLRDRYRDRAIGLGFEGHVDAAAAMA